MVLCDYMWENQHIHVMIILFCRHKVDGEVNMMLHAFNCNNYNNCFVAITVHSHICCVFGCRS